MSKKDIQKIIDDYVNKDKRKLGNEGFQLMFDACIVQLSQFRDELIAQFCEEKFSRIPADEDLEFEFMLALDALQGKNPEKAFEFLEKALLNQSTQDKEHYAHCLLSYPKERVIPVFTKAVPRIAPDDEYAGYALEKILEKLVHWEVPLDATVIQSALKDCAFRVQRVIIPYVINQDLTEYKPELENLLSGSEIYDDFLAERVEEALEKWNG